MLHFYLAKSIGEGFFRNSALLFTFLIIVVPLAQGRPLEAAFVFPAISLGETLASNGLMNLNLAVNAAADYLSVLQRLQAVLLLDSISKQKELSKREEGPLV